MNNGTRPEVTFITLSFGRDFALCRTLCASLDRTMPPGVKHIIYVPPNDLAIFSQLQSPVREIRSERQLLPRGVIQLPRPKGKLLGRLKFLRRNMYWTPGAGLTRGWIMQQIMKISAACQAETETVVHVDSDVAIVRNFTLDVFQIGEQRRLLRIPGAGNTDMHLRWHRTASALLGLEFVGYQDADYIGNLICWRRSNVVKMLAHIEKLHSQEPFRLLAQCKHLSEYILYGIFCDKIMGLEEAGHAVSYVPHCFDVWSDEDLEKWREQPAKIPASQFAVCLQSTLTLDLGQRTEVLESLIR